jgi:hypothetical protein
MPTFGDNSRNNLMFQRIESYIDFFEARLLGHGMEVNGDKFTKSCGLKVLFQ